MTDPRQRAAAAVRRALRTAAHRPTARKILQKAAREIGDALDDDTYGGSYFGSERDPYDRMGLSGYERYDRDTSNANVAAYILWRHFAPRTSLDVGCATGFVVEALRELGVDAKGTDVSQYAVDHAALGARGHLQFGDLLQRLPFKHETFDVVSVLETLEHLPPDAIPRALTELRRVCGGYLVATIPSFGPNPNGPGGWYQVKVRDDLVADYEAKGPDYAGPVPHDDLYRDAKGEPIEGHLTIASFGWWTKQFESAGFVRCASTERAIHPTLARMGLTKYWNLYVLRLPDRSEPGDSLHTATEIADVETRFGLAGRVASADDLAAVEKSLTD